MALLLPLGFFAVGFNLSTEPREDSVPLLDFPDRRIALAVVLRLLVAPVLLLAVSATAIRLPSPYLLEAAMPTAINSWWLAMRTDSTSA